MTFSERVLPPVWVALVGLGLVGALALAYGSALGAAVGWSILLPLVALAGLGLWRTSPRILVTPSSLRAGRATLPARWIGKVAVLDNDATVRARGADADPRAHLVLRTLSSRQSVIVAVTDPRDPHPYWLVSTRHPQELAAALVAARGCCQAAGAAPEHAEVRSPDPCETPDNPSNGLAVPGRDDL